MTVAEPKENIEKALKTLAAKGSKGTKKNVYFSRHCERSAAISIRRPCYLQEIAALRSQ